MESIGRNNGLLRRTRLEEISQRVLFSIPLYVYISIIKFLRQVIGTFPFGYIAKKKNLYCNIFFHLSVTMSIIILLHASTIADVIEQCVTDARVPHWKHDAPSLL